jgi:dTDP-D-glucose 4,6-dehydratase
MGVGALTDDAAPIPTRRGVVGIVGGAGFIGSHFVDRLLADATTAKIIVFDNFSSGSAGTSFSTVTTPV